jgi:hypothetical protein
MAVFWDVLPAEKNYSASQPTERKPDKDDHPGLSKCR